MEMSYKELELAAICFESYFLENEHYYWKQRVEKRLEFLNPLIHELTLKGINIGDISIDLRNEYNSLIMLRNKYLCNQ